MMGVYPLERIASPLLAHEDKKLLRSLAVSLGKGLGFAGHRLLRNFA